MTPASDAGEPAVVIEMPVDLGVPVEWDFFRGPHHGASTVATDAGARLAYEGHGLRATPPGYFSVEGGEQMTTIRSWTTPFFGVTYPVMSDGHVEGLPELMCVFSDEVAKCWQLALMLDGPDEPETIVLTDARLDSLLERAEKLLTFSEILLPCMRSAEREEEIRAVQKEYGGRPRPKTQKQLEELVAHMKGSPDQ